MFYLEKKLAHMLTLKSTGSWPYLCSNNSNWIEWLHGYCNKFEGLNKQVAVCCYSYNSILLNLFTLFSFFVKYILVTSIKTAM